MSKRRPDHVEELPFVALMDTMTNVVGVLIIVLVMIGISLASSVKKILSALPPVTVEQLQEVLKKVAESTPQVDPKKLEEETKAMEEKVKKATESLKTMDITPDKQDSKILNIEELNRQLEERKKERDLKKTDIEKQFAEVTRLKALLDTTPVYQAPPATVVKLPNPRPIPDNAVMHRFIVNNNRVVYLNDEEFLKTVVKEIDKIKRTLEFKGEVKDTFGKVIMVNDRGKQVPKTFLDRAKVMAAFEKMRIGSRDIKVELIGNPNSSRLAMRLTPNPEGGDSIDSMKDQGSTYQRGMRMLRLEPKNVAWFYVFKDSLPTYLAARDYADVNNVPAGWELYGNPYYQVQINDFDVDFVPGKPQPPPPPGTVTIPRPKTTLD